MVDRNRLMTLISCIGTVTVLAGCQSNTTAGTSESRTAAVTTEGPATLGPVTDKDRIRAAEWAAATAGVSFDTGRVIVITPPATSDLQASAAHIADGQVEEARNHRTDALAAYVLAVRAAPDNVDAHMGLAGAMVTKGKVDLALACYKTALDLDPTHVDALVGVAMSHAREREFDLAIRSMSDALDLRPDDATAHERIAIWSYYQGDVEIAWHHSLAAEALGHTMPPQFIRLLEQQRPRPEAG